MSGDAPGQLRHELQILDSAAEVPRRIVLVARLVVVGVVVGFLLLLELLRFRVEELARLVDRERRHAAFRKRKVIRAEEISALGMLIGADGAAALLRQRL